MVLATDAGVDGILERSDFAHLLTVLKRQGYRLVGPSMKDGVVTYAEIQSDDDMAAGISSEAAPGSFRSVPAGDARLFGHSVVAGSPKTWLFPARRKLYSVDSGGASTRVEPAEDESVPTALIGLRPCDVRSISILDRVLIRPPYIDVAYQKARESSFVVVAQCTDATRLCFCTSVGTGPCADEGFDIALTELIDSNGHRFAVTAGSDKGEAVLAQLPIRCPEDADMESLHTVRARAMGSIERHLATDGLKDRLYAAANSDRWTEIAARCLACGNCTSVCPTCFCSTVEDTSNLSGTRSERTRVWDSCFNVEFSYIHGGSVRPSVSARYRQWLTHKLAAWQDQFGSMGCVGCGRCTTWCPAGIDIVEEANAMTSGASVGAGIGR